MIKKLLITLLLTLTASCGTPYSEEEYDIYNKIKFGGNIAQIEKIISEADSIYIPGPCYSACTMVLFPRYKDKVRWSDRSTFFFHAASNEADGKVNVFVTTIIYQELPQKLLNRLKPLWLWDQNFQVVSGVEMRELVE